LFAIFLSVASDLAFWIPLPHYVAIPLPDRDKPKSFKIPEGLIEGIHKSK